MSGARIDREDRMKKFLLGTTALIAAGAFVGAAQAADDDMMAGPVTVGIAGYTTAAIGFASDSSDTKRGVGIDNVFEFGVSGSTTLDNGITVAVSAQVGRSAGGDEAMDEHHTTLSGSFGSLRIGRTESAAFNATVAAPGAGIGGMLGVNYGWFSTAAPAVNTYSGIGAEDALKVVYTTPNFNGLTLGMSYAPNNSEENFNDRSTAGLGEHTAVGITYSTDFMEGGSVALGAGYEMAAGGADGGDASAMRFGINVSVDQLSFGGSMFDDDNTVNADGMDMSGMAYDIGASWSEGATEVGLQYATDAAHGGWGGAETAKAALHLTYTLGPGVLIGGQIASGSVEGSDDVTQIMLGTAVFF
jgi:hypothetical protein